MHFLFLGFKNISTSGLTTSPHLTLRNIHVQFAHSAALEFVVPATHPLLNIPSKNSTTAGSRIMDNFLAVSTDVSKRFAGCIWSAANSSGGSLCCIWCALQIGWISLDCCEDGRLFGRPCRILRGLTLFEGLEAAGGVGFGVMYPRSMPSRSEFGVSSSSAGDDATSFLLSRWLFRRSLIAVSMAIGKAPDLQEYKQIAQQMCTTNSACRKRARKRRNEYTLMQNDRSLQNLHGIERIHSSYSAKWATFLQQQQTSCGKFLWIQSTEFDTVAIFIILRGVFLLANKVRIVRLPIVRTIAVVHQTVQRGPAKRFDRQIHSTRARSARRTTAVQSSTNTSTSTRHINTEPTQTKRATTTSKMTATDQMRQMLDQLMGTARNGKFMKLFG